MFGDSSFSNLLLLSLLPYFMGCKVTRIGDVYGQVSLWDVLDFTFWNASGLLMKHQVIHMLYGKITSVGLNLISLLMVWISYGIWMGRVHVWWTVLPLTSASWTVGIVADSSSYDQSKRLRTGGDYSHAGYSSPSPFHPPAPVWGPHG